MRRRTRLALLALCAGLTACEWAPRPENAQNTPPTATAGTADQTPLVPSPADAKATRPSYNTGRGLFVSNGRLFDAKGNEFRIRGVNRNHFDSPSQPGLSRSGANAVRVFLASPSVGATAYVRVLQTQHLANKEIAIPTMSDFPDDKISSCDKDPRRLSMGVDWWVDSAKVFALIDTASIINIANEWGPSGSILWRDAYVLAVKKMRAAGYRAPLMIDSGGCGQDASDLVNYAADIFESDPQKNIIFSFHLYGGTGPADMPALFARFGALQTSAGMVFVIGEFGPGRNIGPSPTLITPRQVIAAAEANHLGWLAWAWDDNNRDLGESDDNAFSMTLHGPGIYEKPADLTAFGTLLVLDPNYGLRALARPASIF